ncbi:acyltransferase [Cupriavidus necator]|uniref:Acyltransferase n=1 Tax=Cupriavidus necator TaxID=106590 RepID=A0A367PPJ7_CUPNE|nr:acyltransferase [Cupriavidus necator]QQX88681.1 acyltransferase [Cupriavidus necator]RCJ09822.1 acyltransferase [Cupriavidus necator]
MIGRLHRNIASPMLAVLYRALGVNVAARVIFYGRPIIERCAGSKIHLGDGVVLCSLSRYTALGVTRPVIIRTFTRRAEVRVGRNSGLSGVTVCAVGSVSIGENCLIGANVIIFDTDFHPVESLERRSKPIEAARNKPVIIENNVFIGANSIIGKGVTIGENSVVGAGSVVIASVPANCVVAGNPAKVVKYLG